MWYSTYFVCTQNQCPTISHSSDAHFLFHGPPPPHPPRGALMLTVAGLTSSTEICDQCKICSLRAPPTPRYSAARTCSPPRTGNPQRGTVIKSCARLINDPPLSPKTPPLPPPLTPLCAHATASGGANPPRNAAITAAGRTPATEHFCCHCCRLETHYRILLCIL